MQSPSLRVKYRTTLSQVNRIMADVKRLPWIPDITALNILADAVRRYREQPDAFNREAMFAALEAAEVSYE